MLKFILNTFFVKLVLAGLRFLLNVLLARFLGAELRGLYYILQNIVGFLASFGSGSIGEAYIYFHGKGKLSLITIKFFNIFVLIFGAILSSLFLILIFNTTLDEKLNPDIYFWPSLILCILLIYEYLVLQELKARLKIYRANIFYALSKFLLLIFIFSYGAELEPIDVIIFNIYAVIALIIMLLLPFFYYKDYKKFGSLNDLKEDLLRWKEYISFSLKAHFGTILNLAEYRIDALIAAFIIDTRLLGIYSVVLAIGQINFYIINSVNTVLFPTIVRGKIKIGGFLKILRLSLLPVFLVTFLIAISIDTLDVMIFGPDYDEVGKYFIWMIPVIILESFNRLLATLLKSENALGVFNKIAVVSIVIYLPLLVLLANLYGLYGLIIASFISYFVRSSLYVIWMKNKFNKKVKFKEFIPSFKEFYLLLKNKMFIKNKDA